MKRYLVILLGALTLAFSASAAANADTFPWGPNLVGDGQYTYIRTTNMTYWPGGTPRIRFDRDNAHSVNIRAVQCGGDYHNVDPITIPAHDQTYHYVNGTWGYGTCVNFYARSLYDIQTLSGYILS